MTTSRVDSRAGVVWPELLFVFSILLIAASVVIPAILDIHTRRKSVQTYSDIRVMLEAASSYNREYREWPVYDPPERGDVRYGDRRPNRGVINILMAREGLGNEGHGRNPNRIDFIALASPGANNLRFNAEGEVVDPWGSPYQLVFDSNYDNICAIPNSTHGSIAGEGVVIWSKGADRKSETMNDILSWRR